MKWEKELKNFGLFKRDGDLEFLQADNGKFITFPRIVAQKFN
ncbi:MAG: hypothetical protein U5K53_03165 [Halanaerobiales bacterium]|nr:hypothetical protein [Halanaerobiales bacterium]